MSPVKVFISYAKEDASLAYKLYNSLKEAGVSPWLDSEALLPGQNWKVHIERAIESSDYFIALLSSKSVDKRGYVQKELKHALDLLDKFPESEIFVVPVRLEECLPAHEKIKDLHWVDLFPSFEAGVSKILRVVLSSSDLQSSKVKNANNFPKNIRELTESKLAVASPTLASLSTKELTLRWKLAIIIPSITVVLAVTFSYMLFRPDPTDNSPLPYQPSTCEKNVTISVPADMQHISHDDEIKGTYKDLPPGHKIWIIVYPPTIGRFYPQGEAALTNNTWSAKAYTGLRDEAGRRFEIHAVLANVSANNALNLYATRVSETKLHPGMPDLPEGAVICQRIQVTRQ